MLNVIDSNDLKEAAVSAVLLKWPVLTYWPFSWFVKLILSEAVEFLFEKTELALNFWGISEAVNEEEMKVIDIVNKLQSEDLDEETRNKLNEELAEAAYKHIIFRTH